MIGGLTRVNKDVLPYFITVGSSAKIEGLNIIGLKRANFDRENILLLQRVFDEILIKNPTLNLFLEKLDEFKKTKEILNLKKFLKDSKRGVITF